MVLINISPKAVLCAAGLLSFLAGVQEAEAVKDEKAAVRPLPFTPKDPMTIFGIGGQGKVTIMADADAVAALIGKDEAKALVDQVDFNKEKIVFVSWFTSGPPYGSLKHSVTGAGKEQTITFFVQGPPGAGPRGEAARVGADFFAFPKEAVVLFDPKERK